MFTITKTYYFPGVSGLVGTGGGTGGTGCGARTVSLLGLVVSCTGVALTAGAPVALGCVFSRSVLVPVAVLNSAGATCPAPLPDCAYVVYVQSNAAAVANDMIILFIILKVLTVIINSADEMLAASGFQWSERQKKHAN